MDENTQTLESTPELTTDNSDSVATNLEDEIAKALEEPEEVTSDEQQPETEPTKPAEPPKEPKDNTTEYPEKFKKEDGTVDVDNLLKSYKELESKFSSDQNTWKQERADLQSKLDEYTKQQEEQAKQYGFNSPMEMANAYELVNTEANEYYKYIGMTEDPQTVTRMLQDYLSNPTEEKREEIELEFSPEVIRKVTEATARRRFELEQMSQQYAKAAEMTSVENTIKQLCEKHNAVLQDENVKKYIIDQFTKFGSALDFETASGMLSLLEAKDNVLKQQANNIASQQNSKATDKLAAITNSSSAPSSDDDNVDFDKLSPKEQAKLIDKYL